MTYKEHGGCKQCFYFDNTDSTNMFASLHTFAEMLPAGNSATVCVEPLWQTKDMTGVVDQYRPFVGTPECDNGSPGIEAHIWHEE